MKLSAKIGLFGIINGLFLVLIVGIWAYYSSLNNAKDELGYGQQIRAEETINKIDLFLYERYKEIQLSSNSFRHLIDDQVSLEFELKESLLLSGYWEDIKVFNKSGEAIASISRKNNERNLSSKKETELYERALEGEVVYSDLLFENQNLPGVIIMATPIRSSLEEGRKVVGVAMYYLSEYALDNFLQSSWDKTERMYLVNESGNVIAFLHEEDEAPHNSQIDQSTWEKIQQSNGSLEINSLTEDYRALTVAVLQSGYSDYSGNDWYLVAQMPIQKINERAVSEIGSVFISIGSILLFSLVGSIYFTNRMITKPIVELTYIATKMSEEHLELRAPEKSSDEIGQLSKAFNFLMDKLSESNLKMEQKVEDRTNRLSKTMKLMVGRELKMIELKKELKSMSEGMDNKNDDE